METTSIKALAQAILKRNRQGNQKETPSFLTGKNRKPEQQEGKPLRINIRIPVDPFPEWQRNFCDAHGDINHWHGQCPVDLDQCLISKIIDSGGNLDQLRGFDLGQDINTDQVVDSWLESGEPQRI